MISVVTDQILANSQHQEEDKEKCQAKIPNFHKKITVYKRSQPHQKNLQIKNPS